jgi:uncharacterized protein with FMN-binding domain
MKRALIVAGATVVGLAGVLSFHTTPARVTPASLPPSVRSTSTTGGAGRTSTGTTGGAGRTASSRTATGEDVAFGYGSLAVSVTARGDKITGVRIASFRDDGSNRSQTLDRESLPILEDEAFNAQSADIQGVSGASYTSEAFQQSLQSALDRLDLPTS